MPRIQKPEVPRNGDIHNGRPFVDGAKLLVNGEVRPWAGGCEDVLSPLYLAETGERVKIGRQAMLSSETAVGAAKAASDAWARGRGAWPASSLEQRIAAVEGLVARLGELRSEIVRVLQWEICKNDGDAAKEFDRTMDFISALIAAARQMNSSSLLCEEGVHAIVRRSPVGVMLNLGPSNYPFNETYATLIPALLMGNTVCMKIPSRGGLAHFLTMEAFASCFPPGVVNFLSGRGRDTVPPVMASGLVDVFAFIGSSRAADALVRQHPSPHRLRTLLSLDAKNLGVVLPDADLELAVRECVAGSTSYNGQRCTAIKMIMVHKGVADAFVSKFCAAVSSLPAGTPFGKNAITPLTSVTPDFMNELVADAKAKGAAVLNEMGGHRDRSLYFPAVLYPVNSDMEVWEVEQFGPVIPIAAYGSLAEVYDYLDRMPFGQQAAIFTSADAAAGPSSELVQLLDACALATCRVNLNVQCSRGPDCFPFTGRRSSAMGTISVTEALRAVSVETMVASKKPEVITRACRGSAVFSKL